MIGIKSIMKPKSKDAYVDANSINVPDKEDFNKIIKNEGNIASKVDKDIKSFIDSLFDDSGKTGN